MDRQGRGSRGANMLKFITRGGPDVGGRVLQLTQLLAKSNS